MTLDHDYRAIREGAAIGSISPRLQIAVAGNDRASFLQGLLTNDIQALTPGTGCYAAWLTAQGRMLTDMHVLESGGMLLLDVPASTAAATLERLEQFLFSEDVRIGSLADALTGVWLHGPGAAATLERLLEGARGLDEWALHQHTQLEFEGQPVSVARIDQLGVPGYCVYLDRAREPRLAAALHTAGAHVVGADAIEAARVEAGYPVFGVDMTETTIPLEAGIESRAISLTKGCYVGQEIIIRVLHRGGGRVAKRLVGLRIDGPPAGDLARGAKLFSGDREIGEVTSVAQSPRSGTIALGYVHRDFTAPGTAIHVDAASERRPATVTERADGRSDTVR
jgi:folate-binding protein YgfZ